MVKQMLMTLHPTYTLRITIQEPDPTPKDSVNLSRGPFWDSVRDMETTGCDAVLIKVREALLAAGLGKHVRVDLDKFENRVRT